MSCPKCQEGFVLPGDPIGTIDQDFLGAYHASAPNGETSKHALIFLTDGFGLPLKNCKIMADNLAKRLECDVWIPDYFDGQFEHAARQEYFYDLPCEPIGRPITPLDNLRTPDRAGVKMSILDWVKFILFAGIPNILAFIHSRPAVADKRVISVRTTHVIAVSLTQSFKLINLLNETKKYNKLGLVGRVLCSWPRLWDLTKFFFHHITRYCYGGSAAVRFAGTEFIHTAVICHPGGCKISEVEAIRVPTSWACAEGTIQSLSYWIYAEFLR